MRIKLLPYESCIKIGEKLCNNNWCMFEDFGLPNTLFGLILEVEGKVIKKNNFSIYTTKGNWYIPVLFVTYVINE